MLIGVKSTLALHMLVLEQDYEVWHYAISLACYEVFLLTFSTFNSIKFLFLKTDSLFLIYRILIQDYQSYNLCTIIAATSFHLLVAHLTTVPPPDLCTGAWGREDRIG